jgi:hypothetical protein
MDYVGQLREGILEAYTGLVGGFKGTDKGMYRVSKALVMTNDLAS